MREVRFVVPALLLGCGGGKALDAGSDVGANTFDASLQDGICVGQVAACPTSFDDVPCNAQPGDVGRCGNGYFIYIFDTSVPPHSSDYPNWMCYYDLTSHALVGQRVCLELATLCDGRFCAESPAGTPYCDSFATILTPPSCADASTPDGP
jgi:hypothetical protein